MTQPAVKSTSSRQTHSCIYTSAIIVTANPDPVSKSALKLLLERILDLHHITLATRDDNANESLVVRSETFHRFLHLERKIARLVSDYSNCKLPNHTKYSLNYPQKTLQNNK